MSNERAHLPVRIMVGMAPGGTIDLSARLIGQPLQQRLGQAVVVEDSEAGGSAPAQPAAIELAVALSDHALFDPG
jgi:tripartite-type tricarboxylate transporter receptor subunit TctC